MSLIINYKQYLNIMKETKKNWPQLNSEINSVNILVIVSFFYMLSLIF